MSTAKDFVCGEPSSLLLITLIKTDCLVAFEGLVFVSTAGVKGFWVSGTQRRDPELHRFRLALAFYDGKFWRYFFDGWLNFCKKLLEQLDAGA